MKLFCYSYLSRALIISNFTQILFHILFRFTWTVVTTSVQYVMKWRIYWNSLLYTLQLVQNAVARHLFSIQLADFKKYLFYIDIFKDRPLFSL